MHQVGERVSELFVITQMSILKGFSNGDSFEVCVILQFSSLLAVPTVDCNIQMHYYIIKSDEWLDEWWSGYRCEVPLIERDTQIFN